MTGIITVPLHIGDFLSGTMHMDTLEKGAYVMLLLAHYQVGHEGIPNDDLKLARIAGVSPTVWKRIKPIILEKFEVSGEFLQSARVQKVLSDVEQKSASQRAKVLKRWNREDTAVDTPRYQPKPKPKPLKENNKRKAADDLFAEDETAPPRQAKKISTLAELENHPLDGHYENHFKTKYPDVDRFRMRDEVILYCRSKKKNYADYWAVMCQWAMRRQDDNRARGSPKKSAAQLREEQENLELMGMK